MELQSIPIQAAIGWIRRVVFRWYMKTVLGVTGAHVFRDRHAMYVAYPGRKYFSDIRYRTYALWLTGRGVFTDFRPGDPFNVEQVILPHPESPHIAQLDESMDMDVGTVSSIEQGIRNARTLGATVYLYNGWPGVALTFQNPQEEDGSLHIEPIGPHLPSVGRPIIRILRKKNSEAYESYWKMFEGIRDASQEVTDEVMRELGLDKTESTDQ